MDNNVLILLKTKHLSVNKVHVLTCQVRFPIDLSMLEIRTGTHWLFLDMHIICILSYYLENNMLIMFNYTLLHKLCLH